VHPVDQFLDGERQSEDGIGLWGFRQFGMVWHNQQNGALVQAGAEAFSKPQTVGAQGGSVDDNHHGKEFGEQLEPGGSIFCFLDLVAFFSEFRCKGNVISFAFYA